jgi:FMN phosphatase YigB (HAD superfamily)
MAEIDYVFIDNGGVLTDNSQRSPLYRRLVGEFFAPRYGGTHAAWEEANTNTFLPAWGRFLDRVANWTDDRDLSHAVWLYHADWLRILFAAAGVPAPEDDDACAEIGHASERWINPQIVTLFPGVEEAIRSLASRYRLFTASDGFSRPLSETLAPISHDFERLYGPDLVNVPKSAGRRYYDAVFSHAAVDPTRALVLDDNVSNLEAARETGARVVYVTSQPDAGYQGPTIARLADLPGVIETL